MTNDAGQPAISFLHHDNQGLGFNSGSGWTVESLAQPVNGKTHTLRPFFMFNASTYLILSLQALASPTGIVRVMFDRAGRKSVLAYILNSTGIVSTQEFDVETADVQVVVDGTIIGLMIVAAGRVGIVEVCLGSGGNDDYLQALAINLKSATSVWTAQGDAARAVYGLPASSLSPRLRSSATVRAQKARQATPVSKTVVHPCWAALPFRTDRRRRQSKSGPDNLAVCQPNRPCDRGPGRCGTGDAATGISWLMTSAWSSTRTTSTCFTRCPTAT